MLNQFANEDNWKAHYKTTGPEIWNDTHGTVTHCCCDGNDGNNNGNIYLLEREKIQQFRLLGPASGSQIPIRKWPKEYLPKIFDASKVDRVEVSETGHVP
jgi:cysteine synthase B